MRRIVEDENAANKSVPATSALVLINHPALGNRDAGPWEAWKADLVARLGVDVFFEDMPEVVRLVRPPTKVFMACDESTREWLSECVGDQ